MLCVVYVVLIYKIAYKPGHTEISRQEEGDWNAKARLFCRKTINIIRYNKYIYQHLVYILKA